MGYIYKITNIQNNKMYVGQTNNPERRWTEHKCIAQHQYHYKSALYAAMRKYGNNAFRFDIIEECADADMSHREQYWIQELNTLTPNGYNMTPGGEILYGANNPFFGHQHTEATKQLISQKNSGRKYSEEELERCRIRNKGEHNPFFGKHHSEETKRKIIESAQKRGAYQKLSEKMKINNPNAGGKAAIKIPVFMLDAKTEEILMSFESYKTAGDYITATGLSRAKYPGNQVRDVCVGRQETAFGYKWKHVNKV